MAAEQKLPRRTWVYYLVYIHANGKLDYIGNTLTFNKQELKDKCQILNRKQDTTLGGYQIKKMMVTIIKELDE